MPDLYFGIPRAVALYAQLILRFGSRDLGEVLLPAWHTHHFTAAIASTYAAALAKRQLFDELGAADALTRWLNDTATTADSAGGAPSDAGAAAAEGVDAALTG